MSVPPPAPARNPVVYGAVCPSGHEATWTATPLPDGRGGVRCSVACHCRRCVVTGPSVAVAPC